MSATDNQAETGAPQNGTTVIDKGPQEIVIATSSPPVVADKAASTHDVTDVVDKLDAPDTTSQSSEQEVSTDIDKSTGQPKAKPFSDRIGELTGKWRESEREAAYWKSRATAGQQTEAAPKPEVLKAPVRTDFESDEAFNDAVIDHKVDVKLQARESKNVQTQAAQARADTWQTRQAEARVAIPDYDTVMNSANLPVASHVAELMFDHDQGPTLAHHFALHPEVLDSLNKMSMGKAAMEMAKITSEIVKPAAGGTGKDVELPAPKIEKVVEVSKAPPPAKTLGSGRSTETALGDQSMEDFVATRKQQGASWAR